MSLEEFNYIAEIIASIAVIASLVYVGAQVKQSTMATRSAAAQATLDSINNYVGLINASDKLADIIDRGAQGLSGLQGGDLIRFMAFNDQAFIAYESQYLQWKDGALDDRLWQTRKQAAIDLLSQPGQQAWWAARRHWFVPEFRDYLDQLSATEKSKPMHPGSVSN